MIEKIEKRVGDELAAEGPAVRLVEVGQRAVPRATRATERCRHCRRVAASLVSCQRCR
ncbi:MAG: hypothetical protein JNL83_26465 [Myxococcales bacterium]|nr:hypothetical protein [Myxococcales bacterium]